LKDVKGKTKRGAGRKRFFCTIQIGWRLGDVLYLAVTNILLEVVASSIRILVLLTDYLGKDPVKSVSPVWRRKNFSLLILPSALKITDNSQRITIK
jgi:hypothetical protein